MAETPFIPEDKFVTVNGLRVHYLDWGGDRTKKPLYLLHGSGGHARSFDDFAPHFLETHHVVAIDERGCGDSEWSKNGYSVQSYSDDVGEFAIQTGLYPFDYVGASQGSRIGMAVGAYWGQLVDHLVLGDYGPMPDPSPAGRATAQSRLGGGTRTERPRGFFSPQQAFDWHRQHDEVTSDEDLWNTVKNLYRTNWDGILVQKTDPEVYWLNGRTALKEGPYLWDCVAKISCKTMVLNGEISTVLDRPQAEKMAAIIPNRKGVLKVLPGVGHGVTSENIPLAVEAVSAFFAS
jgi:pimeloyl-ACP methyl ester carboxylesterase